MLARKCAVLSLLGGPTVLLVILASAYAKPDNPRRNERVVFSDRLIVPGSRIGSLKLGERREQALEAFPFKPRIDQQYASCGATYAWADSTQGNLFIEFQAGMVHQIGSATPRYRTQEGLTSYSSPEKVRHFYRKLEAYVFPLPSSVALGGRPLVFWVDRTKGIAFAFAYDSDTAERYLYEIIVFMPNTDFCVDNVKLDAPGVQKLSPYSLQLNQQ